MIKIILGAFLLSVKKKKKTYYFHSPLLLLLFLTKLRQQFLENERKNA